MLRPIGYAKVHAGKFQQVIKATREVTRQKGLLSPAVLQSAIAAVTTTTDMTNPFNGVRSLLLILIAGALVLLLTLPTPTSAACTSNCPS